MDEKDQALRHPKPLEDEPKTRHRGQNPAGQTVQPPPVRGFRAQIDSPICRECLGAIAHRLAQPMTALRGSIELGLMGKRTAEDYRSILEQTLLLADNMVKVIVALRDRGDSVAPSGPTGRVNLKSAMEEALAEVKSSAQVKGLHFSFEASQPLDADVSPLRLREALRSLMTWILQNTAGDGAIAVKLSFADGTARICIAPPRLDLQYLQIKMLDAISTPGVLISQASNTGSLDWSLHQSAFDDLGGKLDVLMEGHDPMAICINLPIATAPE
jgi:hypothetical protein